ncbi:MAG: prolyl oligopeptidase family serine peptidase [Duncaniella sp.]|nr:prolyl oligopeptidase family serine peptidase [Duncaniella sp.]
MKRFLLILLALFTTAALSAQHLKAMRGVVPGSYDFWLYTPDPSAAEEFEPKPVVIFLHGASLCGRDLDRVKRYGTIDAIEMGRRLDAYVIAPQNPGGSWNPDKVMALLDYVSDEHNIDYDRVYVIGMSLGGYGTIDVTARYPDRVAAAIAMCGGGSVSDLKPLSEVPLWLIHGTADRAVSISQSDRVASVIRSVDPQSPRLTYDRVAGWNHGSPARLFYHRDIYDWLFSHTLKDPSRSISPTFTLDNTVLSNAYDGLTFKSRSSKATRRKAASRKKTSKRKKK